MPLLGGLIAAKFVLYAGLFYLLGLTLQMGTPVDSLKAAFHRTWLGAAGTMASLVVYILLRVWGTSLETNQMLATVLLWLLRLAIWLWVTTSVYRVTRWRKGKLAIVVAAGLALNVGVDWGLAQLQGDHPFMPTLGQWTLRLC